MRRQFVLRVGRWLLLNVGALIAVSAGAAASTITINNPSFEAPALTCTPGPDCFVTDTFVDWTVQSPVGGTATFRPSVGAGQEFISLPDGLQVAAISNGSGSGGEIYQDLSAVVAANTTYTLTFFVGQRADAAFDPNYIVSLTANGVTLAFDTGASPAASTFVERTIVFSTGPSPAELGQTLRIDVSAPSGSPGQADFDLFSLSASSTVPEPSTLLLLASGMGLLALRFRRRKTWA